MSEPSGTTSAAVQEAPNVQVLSRRAVAILIDSALVVLLENLLSRPFIPVHLRVENPTKLHGQLTIGLALTPVTAVSAVVGVASLLLYFGAFETLFAATPGKMLSRLRVADVGGGRPAWRAIVLRNIVRPIDAFPPYFLPLYIVGAVSVLFSPRRQRLGDRAAHTLVVGSWSVDWIDESAAAVRQRAGITILALLVVALIGSILGYLFPPSISPALKETFSTNIANISTIKTPGAQRLLGVSVGPVHRTGSTATYPLRFTLQTRNSPQPKPCTGTLTYRWNGPVDGWVASRLATRCPTR